MKKFWNSKISDLTWGQYIMIVVVAYAGMIGWWCKDGIMEKLKGAKDKLPSRKYIKFEEEDFDE